MKAMVMGLLFFMAQEGDSLRVLFWNLENFFDGRPDTVGRYDPAFTPRGERHWTRRRFDAKCQAIAKTLLWAGTTEGALPDVVGVAEVGNARAMKRLLQETALRKLDYRLVHFDSPDPRGVEVALLYRKSRLKLLSAKPCHLYQADSTLLPTRDILLALLETKEGQRTAFLVNHHPSKYGGLAVSEPRRRLALGRLRQLADSLWEAGVTRIVAMGDFNDTPDQEAFRLLEPRLLSLGEPLRKQGLGTIKYEGCWEMIDLFFTTPACAGPMKILFVPFLLVPDKAHAGEKPLRTYSGPRYLGGVSDHCPIWMAVPQ